MKNVMYFIIGFLPLLLLASGNPQKTGKSKYQSIEKLISEGKLKGQFLSKGGYSGDCMQLILENTTHDSLYVNLEAGRRLLSRDTTTQDILVVRNRLLALASGEETTTGAYGFCCQSSNGGPSRQDTFSVGRMAPPKWVSLAEFISDRNFPEDALQDAVWAMSDDHSVGAITTSGTENIRPLKEKVAQLKGVEFPWYTVTYMEDTTQVFSGKPKKLEGQFDFYVDTHSIISINVRDSRGRVIYTFEEKLPVNPGEYTYTVDIDLKGWKLGDYTLMIYQDFNTIYKQKDFSL